MAVDLDAVRHHVEILKAIKAKEVELKELKENSRAAIEVALGNQEAGTLDGHVVVTWKFRKSNRLDQKALEKDHPELVASYRKLGESRTFEVVDG